MRIVTMSRDLRPFRQGQDAVVSEALADMLVKAGDASNPRPYPPPDVAPAVPVGEPRETLRLPRGRYMTRKG